MVDAPLDPNFFLPAEWTPSLEYREAFARLYHQVLRMEDANAGLVPLPPSSRTPKGQPIPPPRQPPPLSAQAYSSILRIWR